MICCATTLSWLIKTYSTRLMYHTSLSTWVEVLWQINDQILLLIKDSSTEARNFDHRFFLWNKKWPRIRSGIRMNWLIYSVPRQSILVQFKYLTSHTWNVIKSTSSLMFTWPSNANNLVTELLRWISVLLFQVTSLWIFVCWISLQLSIFKITFFNLFMWKSSSNCFVHHFVDTLQIKVFYSAVFDDDTHKMCVYHHDTIFTLMHWKLLLFHWRTPNETLWFAVQIVRLIPWIEQNSFYEQYQ